MNEDYKRGLITGLAMQPLYVVSQQGGKTKRENYCDTTALTGIMSDDAHCKQITFGEG